MDTKILVTLKMIVQPERRSDLLETMRGMLEPAWVERGCLSYRLYDSIFKFFLEVKWHSFCFVLYKYVILVILWLLGLVSGHTIGGFIHMSCWLSQSLWC